MTPDQVQQVRQALRNRQLPSRTMAARLWDALDHVHTSIKNPGAVTSSNRGSGVCRDADDTEKYTP